ncbi:MULTISPECIES: hypothetical protein [unclassified Pseudomonas]|uniref:hypothetical protein n=1 Tax=unclassified Pseudomonas TaxID=196821 RepID=UPI001FD4AFDD|nr:MULTISPECIES: hypothetical protein [unclassified Pseudomonas]
MLPIAATAVPAQPPIADAVGTGQVSQNLFEHMARQPAVAPTGTSPAQLGAGVLDNLDGFFNRTQRFAERAADLGARQTDPAGAGHPAPAQAAADPQLQKVVESLSLMFDHSIETQMVVRGATQVSGAANTLLKGQ